MARGGRAAVDQAQLDLRVAAATGVHVRAVRKVTAAFIAEMKRAILEEGSCGLRAFGRIRLVRERVLDQNRKGPSGMATAPIRVRIIVKKSPVFTKQAHDYIKDGIMEKYGVDESVDQKAMEKAASDGCPLCGKAIIKHGSVLMCPTHGTEPFEKKAKR